MFLTLSLHLRPTFRLAALFLHSLAFLAMLKSRFSPPSYRIAKISSSVIGVPISGLLFKENPERLGSLPDGDAMDRKETFAYDEARLFNPEDCAPSTNPGSGQSLP